MMDFALKTMNFALQMKDVMGELAPLLEEEAFDDPIHWWVYFPSLPCPASNPHHGSIAGQKSSPRLFYQGWLLADGLNASDMLLQRPLVLCCFSGARWDHMT